MFVKPDDALPQSWLDEMHPIDKKSVCYVACPDASNEADKDG